MYLADVQEWTEKFELFIPFPEDEELKAELDKVFEVLAVCYDHVSYSIKDENGAIISGWAMFPIHGEDEKPGEDYEVIHPAIIKFQKQQVYGYTYRNRKVFNRCEQCYDIYEVLKDGLVEYKDVDVECFYFYDDISRYE